MTGQLHLAVLGAGGLGKGMVQRAQMTRDFKTVAVVDSGAYLFDPDGIPYASIENLACLREHPDSIPSINPIMDLFQTHGEEIQAVFVALPNLPVDFIPKTVEGILLQSRFRGVMVDALKRTSAVERMLPLDPILRDRRVLYITGAGATPGFLSTVAAVAAQSFVEVKGIDIRFGVGISNWEAYRATIREDFLHVPGFDAQKVAQMTDEEIEAELEKRNGILELHNMEHADDIILELAGICPREKVTVGGVVDTRNAKKPVSTTVTVTGTTAAGVESSHVLTLGDETTMVDNVCGPALGFLRSGFQRFRRNNEVGLVTSADLIPQGDVQAKVPVVL